MSILSAFVGWPSTESRLITSFITSCPFFNHYFRKYFKLVSAVMVTSTTDIVFPLFTFMHALLGCGEFYSSGLCVCVCVCVCVRVRVRVPKAYEMVCDNQKLEKCCFRESWRLHACWYCDKHTLHFTNRELYNKVVGSCECGDEPFRFWHHSLS
jgi:hypothetical protein